MSKTKITKGQCYHHEKNKPKKIVNMGFYEVAKS